jgi:hypothetical protein
MSLENLCGFGCAAFGPGGDWRRYRGFSLHNLIILDPHKNVKGIDESLFVCFS